MKGKVSFRTTNSIDGLSRFQPVVSSNGRQAIMTKLGRGLLVRELSVGLVIVYLANDLKDVRRKKKGEGMGRRGGWSAL